MKTFYWHKKDLWSSSLPLFTILFSCYPLFCLFFRLSSSYRRYISVLSCSERIAWTVHQSTYHLDMIYYHHLSFVIYNLSCHINFRVRFFDSNLKTFNMFWYDIEVEHYSHVVQSVLTYLNMIFLSVTFWSGFLRSSDTRDWTTCSWHIRIKVRMHNALSRTARDQVTR